MYGIPTKKNPFITIKLLKKFRIRCKFQLHKMLPAHSTASTACSDGILLIGLIISSLFVPTYLQFSKVSRPRIEVVKMIKN